MSLTYDSRQAYLTGLSRGRLGFDSRKAYLTGLRFDPTKSYLTGCKCKGMGDYSYADIAAGTTSETPLPSMPDLLPGYAPPAPAIGPALPVSSVNWGAIFGTPAPAPPPGTVTGPGGTVATISPSGTVTASPGYSVNPSGQIVPASSWLAESTLLAGFTNQTVAIWAAGIIAVLSVMKKKRR